MRRLKRAGLLILTLLLCLTPVLAAEQETSPEASLEARMEAFLTEHGLQEDNFAISFYIPETGERYGFNETTLMTAASVYKVPLNMYYYEQLPELDKIGGMTMEQAHYKSIVLSENEISHKMIYNLGTFPEYRELMLKTYTGIDPEKVGQTYFHSNSCSTSYMLEVLTYLYEHQDTFPQLLQLMKDSDPTDDYLRRYVREVDIAHKCGLFDGALNDVGIVYGPRTYLVACFTQDRTDGKEIIGLANQLLFDYVQETSPVPHQPPQTEQEQDEVPRVPVVQLELEKQEHPVVTLKLKQEDRDTAMEQPAYNPAWWWMALALPGSAAGIAAACRQKQKQRKSAPGCKPNA